MRTKGEKHSSFAFLILKLLSTADGVPSIGFLVSTVVFIAAVIIAFVMTRRDHGLEELSFA